MTFQELRTAADKMDCLHGIGSRVDNILDQARINADDTVYAEKARPSSEYDRIAADTVAELLSYSSDAEAQAWFRGVGFSW